MTDLELGIWSLVIAAVAVVFIINKWQEHKHRRLGENIMRPAASDVLLNEPTAAPHDPQLTDNDFSGHIGSGTQADSLPHALAAAADNHEEPHLSAADSMNYSAAAQDDTALPDIPKLLIDERFSWLARLDFAEAFAPKRFFDNAQAFLPRMAKQPLWVGFDERHHLWQPLNENSDFSPRHLCVALPLCRRDGPVSAQDLLLFEELVAHLSDSLMGMVQLAHSSEEMAEKAASLDAFCAEVDLEICLNVVRTQQPFSGVAIRHLAERRQMVLLPHEEAFVKRNAAGQTLFRMVNQNEQQPFTSDDIHLLSTTGVTFILDVPLTEDGVGTFELMLQETSYFAQELGGEVVDDNRKIVDDKLIAHLQGQFIAQPQQIMRDFGLEPGSVQAQRLFS